MCILSKPGTDTHAPFCNDNLKSDVLERRGDRILFHPRLLELSAHYHFAPQPCRGALRINKDVWSEP
jgi:hypothetical protein